ncbi:glucosamine-6-phosphate deaminase [Paenibacillus sp. KQZ6P-2]|uniref:Glucosamine-6-phosphate deaminase n=1 Tax=Paenibacillus mangrovi TaxID=2931978 RepID=A0A9X2B1Y8_9BACL|nr:glucosamine-6-phosphate deaminase [Paenibacillus mangrovi]MCJ8012029.1 glucosamine-6-phosphate deaminase [Paenibacillus mangrovi]
MTRAFSAEKAWAKDRLLIQQYASRDELGRAAAEDVAEAMREKLKMQEAIRMVFAAAPSQNEFLHYLVRAEGIDWKRVTAFHMDEYIGLGAGAPQRFSHFLTMRLFNQVHPGTIHLIDGSAEPVEECKRYAALLQEAPLDMVCLGIGENGHIAFNDPPVADFEDPYIVKRAQLDDLCRQQQVHDGCFERLEDVPEHALTMTIPALVSAEKLFCIVPGAAKRNAVQGVLEGAISPSCPASILRTHANCQLYLDRESYPGEIQGG